MKILRENLMDKKVSAINNSDVDYPLGNLLLKKLNLPENKSDSLLIATY